MDSQEYNIYALGSFDQSIFDLLVVAQEQLLL
jgi:hypothetical protein